MCEHEIKTLNVPLCEPASPLAKAINACSFVLNELCKGPTGEPDYDWQRRVVECLRVSLAPRRIDDA